MITVYVNDTPVQVEDGTKLLHCATKAGFYVPTLCYHEDLPASGNCGLCLVETAEGRMVRSCTTPAWEGARFYTHNKRLHELRKGVLELILSNHPDNCVECIKNDNCELQSVARRLNMPELLLPNIKRPKHTKDLSSLSVTLNPAYCIQCGRCVYVCNEIQGVHALENSERGFSTFVGPALGMTLDESECVKCGQCSAHCPVAAITEKDDTEKVWDALNDPDLVLVAQEAPAVRVALGEAFGMAPGTNVVGKMYTALRRMGFKYVFDTNFGADLTIMEEAWEFADLFLQKPQELPLITSCCPSWVDYLEKFHHDLIPHFSTAKSPHQMVGTMVKTYWAEKMGIPKEKIFLVSVMPCTAKKYEIDRLEDMYASGSKDVDATITTRELARMLKELSINLPELPDGKADNPLGEYTGAGTIFGASGGVMEAALRTAVYYITGKDPENVDFEFTRGLKGIKRAEIEVAGHPVRIAVASGLANVAEIMNEVREAKNSGKQPPYHFIEVMACRGGCVGGGGQPYGSTNQIRKIRAEGLYSEDAALEKRMSHRNPSIQKIYEEFLEKPNSHKAHELLHTSYIARPPRDTCE